MVCGEGKKKGKMFNLGLAEAWSSFVIMRRLLENIILVTLGFSRVKVFFARGQRLQNAVGSRF